jgi:hypothetical protein
MTAFNDVSNFLATLMIKDRDINFMIGTVYTIIIKLGFGRLMQKMVGGCPTNSC